MRIDGTTPVGGGIKEVLVTAEGRLLAEAVTSNQAEQKSIEEKGYAFNTNGISLTTDTESGIFYFKNDEPWDVVLDLIKVYLGVSNATGDTKVRIYRNPDDGTLISAGTALTAINRNFGSSRPIVGTSLFGGEGSTILPAASLAATILQQDKTAFVSGIPAVLKRGSSIAVSVTPPTGNTGMEVAFTIGAHVNEPAA